MDETFVHGFSHGSTGDKLKGKKEFSPPLKQFANLCQMQWCGYVYTGGVSYINRNDNEKLMQMKEKALNHERRLLDVIDKAINSEA